MLNSIRNQIFAAFLALSLVTGAIGVFGIVGITSAGGIVGRIYDHPLMAINFARSADLTFSEMNNALLRSAAGAPAGVDGQSGPDSLAESFFEDLAVARERCLSTRAATLIDQIAGDVRQWESLRRPGAGRSVGGQDGAMARLATATRQKFDTLIELTDEDGFIERQKAAKAIAAYRWFSIVATGAALSIAVVLTLLLARRILRPLSAAAMVANRIAAGELETPIPSGGAGETGILLRSMTVMQDNIRAMMEREAAQRRSAQGRLLDAVEGSGAGMILVDADDRIVIANSEATGFFPSIAPLLIKGNAFADVVGGAAERPTDLSTAQDWLDMLAGGGEIALSTGRWLMVTQSPTREGGRFLFLTDITLLKAREESLKATQRAAEAASIAKSNFLATMGHELRTPLNAVIGFSEMIAGEHLGPLGDPQYVEYAGDVVTSARHLLGIINDVLELAKSADGQLALRPDRIALRDLLVHCARKIAGRCHAAGLPLRLAPAEADIEIWADEEALQRALHNLLSNAVKFSDGKGEVTLTAGLREDGRVEIVVADQGIGMTAQEIATALAPFGQVDSALARRYEGVGLGLPLTRALVELHGGQLEIESAPGAGTSVRVLLPPPLSATRPADSYGAAAA